MTPRVILWGIFFVAMIVGGIWKNPQIFLADAVNNPSKFLTDIWYHTSTDAPLPFDEMWEGLKHSQSTQKGRDCSKNPNLADSNSGLRLTDKEYSDRQNSGSPKEESKAVKEKDYSNPKD